MRRACGGVGRQGEGPPERSTSEPAARGAVVGTTGSTASATMRAASGYGHLTRSRPQYSALSAAAPQWEPRKPLAGIHAAMRADEMLKRVVKAVQKPLRE